MYYRNIYVTIKIEVKEYTANNGKNYFSEYFNDLHKVAAAKINAYLERIRLGNFSSVKGVGGGVFECRIDFGPGYRVYFGKDGEALVILLAGGTKKRQQHDITKAHELWQEYKEDKKG